MNLDALFCSFCIVSCVVANVSCSSGISDYVDQSGMQNVKIIEITNVYEEKGGIGKVEVQVFNDSGTEICVFEHVSNGAESVHLFADIVNQRIERINGSSQIGLNYPEPTKLRKIQENERQSWVLNFGGKYSKLEAFENNYWFRVEFEAQPCDGENINLGDVKLLVSEFFKLGK